MRLVRFQVSPHTGNFKRCDIINHVNRLTSGDGALPVRLSEATASILAATQCDDRFVVQRSRQTSSPVAQERYNNVFESTGSRIIDPIIPVDLELSPLFR